MKTSHVVPSLAAMLLGAIALTQGCGSSTDTGGAVGGSSTSSTSGQGGASSSSSSSSSTSASSSTSSSSSTSTSSSTSSSGAGGASSSSTSSTGSSSTSSSSGAGGGSGTACTYGGAACPASEYCDAPGCNAGTCKTIPVEKPDKAAQCGCDGATYWNDTVAATHGMSIASAGECVGGATCGGFANQKCAAGVFCNYGGNDANQCGTDLGYCWGMPKVCPMPVGFGPSMRACNDKLCTGECDLIKSGKTWYPDLANCPQ